MTKIVNRQLVNIAMNAATANPATIGINLRFVPDIVIVRQVCYSTSEGASNNLYQLYSDLVPDQILAFFGPTNWISYPNTQFIPRSNFSSGSVIFNVQAAPVFNPGTASGTGTNALTADATGNLGVMLEFQKFSIE